jgi:hypothetical protein
MKCSDHIRKKVTQMNRVTKETSLIAVSAMAELSPCHTEFLENGVTIKEEEEHIRMFIANGTLW